MRGWTLTAHPGEIIGITGPVACGKSTLGRVFLCEAPYGGSARFGGKEFSALTPREIASTVGYLGHDPELSADTVQNNVLCGSKQDPMPWLAAVALKDEVQAMENGAGHRDRSQRHTAFRRAGPAAGAGPHAGASPAGAGTGRPILGAGPQHRGYRVC